MAECPQWGCLIPARFSLEYLPQHESDILMRSLCCGEHLARHLNGYGAAYIERMQGTPTPMPFTIRTRSTACAYAGCRGLSTFRVHTHLHDTFPFAQYWACPLHLGLFIHRAAFVETLR